MRPAVLIAEADELRLAAYEAFLAGAGLRVQTASTALDCLNALRRDPPALLVLDADLPWGSGIGVLVVMEEEPELSRIPTILLAEQLTPLSGLGCSKREYAVLLKPTSPTIVAAAIRQFLTEPRVLQASTGAAETTRRGVLEVTK